MEEALKLYQAALIKLSLDFEDNSLSANPLIEQLLSKLVGLQIIEGKANAFYKRYKLENNFKDLASAFENYNFATQIIQELRNNFLAAGSKNELAKQSLSIYEAAIMTANLLYKKTKEKSYKEKSWLFAEQNKARLLEETLQDNYARVAGGLPTEELENELALKREITHFEREINNEGRKMSDINEKKIKLWTNSLFDLETEYKELINRFENEYPAYYALKYETKKANIKKLRDQLINDKNALLEYFVGAETVYLFCITQSNFDVFEFEKPVGFDQDINTLRSIASQSPFDNSENFDSNRNKFVKLSHQFYKSYLEAAISTLPPEIEQLIIIPDDNLAYLPFELLLMEAAAENEGSYGLNSCAYLFERYSISSNYSASLLSDHSAWEANDKLKPFLGFAPTFGDELAGASRACTGNDIYTLQCNREEVMAIKDLFGGEIITDKDADTESFKNKMQESRILHLATHACIDENNPDLNRIYFADDYITGTDLNNLKLNAELAVLSACNTGSGKLVKGEGVMSLSRSFILAGCPSTLTSLWSVDDCTTSEIMIRYYKNLAAGLQKDKALRQAKLDHLASADKVSSHPYYWAAFIQSGNIEPMVMESGFPSFWVWLILPALFLLILFIKRNQSSGRIQS